MTPDRLLDISTVAYRLRVTPATVRNWIRAGKLLAERTPSGRRRVRQSALAALLQKDEKSENRDAHA